MIKGFWNDSSDGLNLAEYKTLILTVLVFGFCGVIAYKYAMYDKADALIIQFAMFIIGVFVGDVAITKLVNNKISTNSTVTTITDTSGTNTNSTATTTTDTNTGSDTSSSSSTY